MFSVKVFNGSEEEKEDVTFPDSNEELMKFNITEETYPEIVFAGSDLDTFSAGGGYYDCMSMLVTNVLSYYYFFKEIKLQLRTHSLVMLLIICTMALREGTCIIIILVYNQFFN